MVSRDKETELILNPDGSIYHLHLHPEQIAPNIVLVGDPQRVEVLSSQFQRIDHRVSNREFITHTGVYQNVPVSVIGTGIGTDNIDIVVNELDALFNIDLKTLKVKEELTSLRLVRLGTTGLLQADIPVDSFIASRWGLGLDALLHFYAPVEGVIDEELTRLVRETSGWNTAAGEPYAVAGSEGLLDHIARGMEKGITLTAPGFYGPQGRVLRLQAADPGFIERIAAISYQGSRVLNFEMETSALYGLGRMLGHEVLTVCVAVANRVTGDFSKSYRESVARLSTIVLDRLTSYTRRT